MFEKDLSLKEKIRLTSGKNNWEFNGIKDTGIKSVRVSDGPSGLRYVIGNNIQTNEQSDNAICFLSESSAASTFNKDLLYKLGEAMANECRKKKVDILLAPGMNIKRLPLCGRNFEYYSEDPFLTSELATSFVLGLQNNGVGACLKHFLCNNQETYRYTINSIVDERALNEIYTYAFQKVIKATNPISIMTSYNKVNGLYPAENKDLLLKVRKDWGFNGLFMSDWGAVNNPINSLVSGLNIEMPSNEHSVETISKAIDDKTLSKDVLDNNVNELRDVYKRIGENRNMKVNLRSDSEIKKVAYDVAKEAVVLLKNEHNILPLNSTDDIMVIGELFQTPNTQGYGSSRINYDNNTDFFKEFAKFTKSFTFKQGYNLKKEKDCSLMKEALYEASKHDKIIIFVGSQIGDMEGNDRSNLSLPYNQLAIINKLIKLKKKIIVVINTGSVVELPFKDDVEAIIQSSLLGEVHERVVSETLFGKINPSGKLAETYPISYDDTLLKTIALRNSHDSFYLDSIYVGYRYYDSFKKEVSYPFGHGLSYSKFIYQNLKVDKVDEFDYEITFDLTNDSDYDGQEVCQVYIRKKEMKSYHPYQELKAFSKFFVKKQQTINVKINLSRDAFEFYNDASHRFEIESGVYEIAIGSSSRDLRLVKFIKIIGNDSPLRFSREQLLSYYNCQNLEMFEFVKILGNIGKSNIDKRYSYNSTIFELRHHVLGKIMYKMIKKEYLKQNSFIPSSEALKLLDYLPLRMIVAFSNGILPYSLVDDILYAMNDNFFKGTYRVIKGLKEIK